MTSELSDLGMASPSNGTGDGTGDVFVWRACVFGPEGTSHDGGIFYARLCFPDNYPWKPPVVSFTPPLPFHPNVDAFGRVPTAAWLSAVATDKQRSQWTCPDRLDGWNPSWNVVNVLKCLQAMLATPQPAFSVNPDADVPCGAERSRRLARAAADASAEAAAEGDRKDAHQPAAPPPATTPKRSDTWLHEQVKALISGSNSLDTYRFEPCAVAAPDVEAFEARADELAKRASAAGSGCRRIVAFHGTPSGAVPAIFAQGFDVSKRTRQAHGPGEYFAESPRLAEHYAGSGTIVVVQLLLCRRGRDYRRVEIGGHSAIVAKDPTCILPCGVLRKRVCAAVTTIVPRGSARSIATFDGRVASLEDLAAATRWEVMPAPTHPAAVDPVTLAPLGGKGERILSLRCCAVPPQRCTFNESTIVTALRCQPRCPACGQQYEGLRGPQPAGSLAVSKLDAPLCAGHEAAGGTLLVMCEFPDGVQGSHHPRPGVRYSGVTRRGFYPDDAVGRRCVRLLWAAFSRGQLFRIGDSLSTGIADTVVYGLHQKSRPSGGATQHGWPDTGYLERLQSECALVGIFLPPV